MILKRYHNEFGDPNQSGMRYRGCTYAHLQVRLSKDRNTESACLDTGCFASLIGCQFLKAQRPQAEVRLIVPPLTINGNRKQYTTVEYVIEQLRVPGHDSKGNPAEALITRELHTVDNLQPNVPIGTDIMLPEPIEAFCIYQRVCPTLGQHGPPPHTCHPPSHWQ